MKNNVNFDYNLKLCPQNKNSIVILIEWQHIHSNSESKIVIPDLVKENGTEPDFESMEMISDLYYRMGNALCDVMPGEHNKIDWNLVGDSLLEYYLEFMKIDQCVEKFKKDDPWSDLEWPYDMACDEYLAQFGDYTLYYFDKNGTRYSIEEKDFAMSKYDIAILGGDLSD